MLGKLINPQNSEGLNREVSTRVLDAIKKYWKDESWVSDVSLRKKDEIWQEWWIGASSISKMCPRKYALMSAVGIDSLEKKVFKPDEMWNFGVGKAYHTMFQHDIFSYFPNDILLGRWKKIDRLTGEVIEIVDFENELPDGMLLERGWGTKPEGNGWFYDEPKIRIPEYRIVVKIDAILKWPDSDDIEIQEIKTMKSDYRNKLDPNLGGSPNMDHVEQLNVGMWATGAKKGRLIYVFKDEKYLTKSIVEHVIYRNDSIINKIKSKAVECIRAVKFIEDSRDNIINSKYNVDCGDIRLEDLEEEEQLLVRTEMNEIAKDIPRLEECKLKSKGRPKYCDGRDLCFGVRRKTNK